MAPNPIISQIYFFVMSRFGNLLTKLNYFPTLFRPTFRQIDFFEFSKPMMITKAESRFFAPLRKTKIDLKNRMVREIGGKLQCSTEREATFGASYREVRKNDGSKDQNSNVVS